MIYSDGEYESEDVDFILESVVPRKALDDALARLGFRREGDTYVHARSHFFVEFPRGPLAIGQDVKIVPVELKVGPSELLALSPTDSCRDRLAAFYHWNDRQSLEVAVSIALNQRLDLDKIRAWSAAEGSATKYKAFMRELGKRAKRR